VLFFWLCRFSRQRFLLLVRMGVLRYGRSQCHKTVTVLRFALRSRAVSGSGPSLTVTGQVMLLALAAATWSQLVLREPGLTISTLTFKAGL